ncbi:hypothetical protein EG329_004094 [Mollisiaceae sp. DMI_Dod_QoI]|nr:hypothetical protein EG329_004094 [Helotiales sp. DMI_Dod_QoI]
MDSDQSSSTGSTTSLARDLVFTEDFSSTSASERLMAFGQHSPAESQIRKTSRPRAVAFTSWEVAGRGPDRNIRRTQLGPHASGFKLALIKAAQGRPEKSTRPCLQGRSSIPGYQAHEPNQSLLRYTNQRSNQCLSAPAGANNQSTPAAANQSAAAINAATNVSPAPNQSTKASVATVCYQAATWEVRDTWKPRATWKSS